MIYYHYNRCGKSRAGLALLQEKGHQPGIRHYMDEPLTPDELSELLTKLDLPAEALIRKEEKLWKEEYRELELSEDELILAMIEHPQLMQRPILATAEHAALGRPPELLLSIL